MKIKNIVFSGFAAAILMGAAHADPVFQIASKAYVDDRFSDATTAATDVAETVGNLGDLNADNDNNSVIAGAETVVEALDALDEAVTAKQNEADSNVATAGNYIAAGHGVAANLTALDTATKAAKDKADAAVPRQMNGNGGKALIFNENDGGGAKFENTDGTDSFTGVNDGGKDGIAAQIYAVDRTSRNGARIDINQNGMYYTVGNAAPAQRMVDANKIATQGDITNAVNNAMGGSVGDMDTLNDGANTNFDNPADVVGALNNLDDAINLKQNEADSNVANAGNYIAAGHGVASNLTALDSQLKTTTDKANAAVPRQMNGNGGKALIFNENDGGGAKFENTDGTDSFTGVNDGGKDGIAAQIYAVDRTSRNGARIDINQNGMYYTVGNAAPAQRMVEANKIATLGDITNAVGSVGSNVGNISDLTGFATQPTSVVAALNDLQSNKLNKPIPDTCTAQSQHCVLHRDQAGNLSWVDITVPYAE